MRSNFAKDKSGEIKNAAQSKQRPGKTGASERLETNQLQEVGREINETIVPVSKMSHRSAAHQSLIL